MDVQRLKDSFARVAMHGDAVPLFFYSDLFLRHPETRELFRCLDGRPSATGSCYALARVVAERRQPR